MPKNLNDRIEKLENELAELKKKTIDAAVPYVPPFQPYWPPTTCGENPFWTWVKLTPTVGNLTRSNATDVRWQPLATGGTSFYGQ